MKVFIDGRSGTTGLRIEERLSKRKDVEMIVLPEEERHDNERRAWAINESDVAFFCLPDAAAIEAAGMVNNDHTVIIDTSTAHRTNPDWAYGFPELSDEHREKIVKGKKIAVPGCHASGFIALVYPLVQAGLMPKEALLSVTSLTGYSGGGKNMIAQYGAENRDSLLGAPRQYGIAQKHKHLPEMQKVTGIGAPPVFLPIVADFYSGMEVTVPVQMSLMAEGTTVEKIKEVYRNKYTGPIVSFKEASDEEGFLSALALSGKDSMEISVYGNDDRAILVARYDNLGKGASGAALQCMNIVTGSNETEGLDL